ncbi:hypothetical protein LCGC14_2398660, partial [marine sediment metagenome]
MSKTSDVGIVESHVEKAVLAISAIILVFMLFDRVLASPRRIELKPPAKLGMRKQAYGPEEVDAALREMSARLEEKLKEAKPPPDPIRKWPEDLEWKFKNPFSFRPGTPLVAGAKIIVPWRPPKDALV